MSFRRRAAGRAGIIRSELLFPVVAFTAATAPIPIPNATVHVIAPAEALATGVNQSGVGTGCGGVFILMLRREPIGSRVAREEITHWNTLQAMGVYPGKRVVAEREVPAMTRSLGTDCGQRLFANANRSTKRGTAVGQSGSGEGLHPEGRPEDALR